MRKWSNHTFLTNCAFYTEGPVIDAAGGIFYTDCAGKGIYTFDQAGQPLLWAGGVCPNGQFILPNGDHLVCDSRAATIMRFDANGNRLADAIKGSCAGTEVFVPNDLVVSRAGNLYFTDSIRHTGKLCLKAANGEEQVLASGLDFPNGLVLSHNKNRLYMAESYRNRILTWALDTTGRPIGEPAVFGELPQHPSGEPDKNCPDGLALDEEGNLYVAHYGMQAIQVLDPSGKLLASIDTGLPLTSNIFLTRDTAIITGGFQEPGPGAVVKFTIGS